MTLAAIKAALQTNGLDGGADGTIQVTELTAVLEAMLDSLYTKPDAGAPVLTEGDGTLTLAANLIMNAGWMILQGSSKAGFGGLPNRNTSAKIQAYGAINSDGGYEFYAPSEGAGTTTHAFYVSGAASLYTFILRNYFNDFTISSIRSKSGAPTTADRESTMALVRTDDAGNEEIVDYYNQTYYASGDKIAKAMGIRMIAVGTGLLRPFYVDWKRSTGAVVDGLKITPPTDDAGTGARADWAIPVYDKNGAEVLGGGGAAGIYDLIYEHREVSGVNGGVSIFGVNTRIINTEVFDRNNNGSLASNQITLAAGTYNGSIYAVNYWFDRNTLYLYNVTTSTIAIQALSMFSSSTAAAPVSIGHGRFVANAGDVFELRQYIKNPRSPDGLGVPSSSGNPEIYSRITLAKE